MNNNYPLTKILRSLALGRIRGTIIKLPLFFFATLCMNTQVKAQIPLDHTLSVGLSFGANHITGSKIAVGGKKISPLNLQANARYLFNDLLGLSGHYAYNGFSQESGTPKYGFHRVVIEGIVNLNLGEAFNLYDFDLYLHAGGGPSLSSPTKDKMFVVMGGLTPEYRINKKWAIKGDVSYVFNTGQNFDFTGVYLGETNGKANNEGGNVMNYSLGLQFYIGADNRKSGRYFF